MKVQGFCEIFVIWYNSIRQVYIFNRVFCMKKFSLLFVICLVSFVVQGSSHEGTTELNACPVVAAYSVAEASLVTGNEYEIGRIAGFSQGRRVGYYSGKNVGLQEGFDAGYQCGCDQDFQAGRQQGLTEGFQEGCDQGYAIGENTGRIDGMIYGYSQGQEHGMPVAFNAGLQFGLILGASSVKVKNGRVRSNSI